MGPTRLRGQILAVAVVSLFAARALAQETPDPFSTARMHLGPVAFTPTLVVSDVGIDANVFNDWENPKQDFTATVGSQADAWLRLGRARVNGRGSLRLLYFNKYASERSVNGDGAARVELPLTHLKPYASASYLTTRERFGFEIDARARHYERAFTVGLDVPVTSRTTIGVSVRRTDISYAADAVFLGTYLRDVFNRKLQTLGASLRYKLTPLTALVLQADAESARFRFSPGRDSDTLRVMPGVEFSTFALINGSASVGFRKLDMLGPGMPDYRGPVAAVELGYTLLGATRFSVRAERDAYYSFEIESPYYVLDGVTGSITQHVTGAWDVVARAGRQRLDYRCLSAECTTTTSREDLVTSYGGGFGYRVGSTARVGLNIDSSRRHSPAATRDYEAVRIGTFLTYGF
jgi:hypothetical protein